MAAKKTLQYFLGPLLKKFFQDMGREPNNLEMLLIRQQAGQQLKNSNKIIQFPQKRSFIEEIEAMKKSGDLVDKDQMIISDKITEREMFKNSNLNKPTQEITEDTGEGFIDFVRKTDPEGAAKLQKAEDEIKAAIEAGNKRAIENLKKKKKKSDEPDDMATGGLASFYTGGMVDVEPSLSDIGHGSDALMARTRLISPGAQGTTSTGLNYLLAEDNDNIRVPFSAGGGGRRAFLKLMATLGGGIAGLKSGLFTTGGKEATKKAVTETVKQSAGSGAPPPYFFKLVEKIKTLGDDTLASQDKAKAYKYKDYVMEEDFAGNIEIIKKNMDDMYPEEVYIKYTADDTAVPNKKGFVKSSDYEEFTARPDGDGKMKDVEQGVPDEVIEEGTMFEDNITDFGKTKKADGGRIGFSAGNLAKLLAGKKITGSSRGFLERVFGKERFATMIENDPELHRGLLEVVEMFRKRDKEGLKMYMQKFLPHMDDATVEDFIIGGGGTEGIQGQLIRLGSGRDYKGKLEMMKKADNMRKLDELDVDKMKPNANGGLITMLGE